MLNHDLKQKIAKIFSKNQTFENRDVFNAILEGWESDHIGQSVASDEDFHFSMRQLWNMIYPSGLDDNGCDFNSSVP